jgi:glycosyltransferase involved in cell wall biosynthesis
MTEQAAASIHPDPAMPLVSIIVPAYNAAGFLREALDSLLAQTYRNTEIILLDDASTDATPQIATEYAGRIAYVRQPSNLGIYDNVNLGIARAEGDFIATYHSDDVYLPTIVEAQVAYLNAHPEVGALFASAIFIDAESREYGRMPLPQEIRGEEPLDYRTVLNALLRYKNRFLICPAAIVRASVHREVGSYRPRYGIVSDLDMWLRIASRYPIAVLESHLIKYRRFHGSSSEHHDHLRTSPEGYFFILDERLEGGDRALAEDGAIVNYEAHRSEDRLMAAISHYIKGQLVDGRRALSQVRIDVILRARQVQRWRLLALTFGMWGLLRLPRIESLARLMYRRWHARRAPLRRAARNRRGPPHRATSNIV